MFRSYLGPECVFFPPTVTDSEVCLCSLFSLVLVKKLASHKFTIFLWCQFQKKVRKKKKIKTENKVKESENPCI